MAIFQPPDDYTNSVSEAFVDIYPLTGGVYTLAGSSSQILSLSTQKYIRGQQSPGSFTIQLAPGGPKGVDGISWTSILNQFSLCVIYMRKGSSNQVVMVGVIDYIRENQVWSRDKTIRIITITGYDFSIYMMNFAYYVLSYLGLIANLPEVGGPAGSTAITTPGYVIGTPNVQGDLWFKNVFLGDPANNSALQNQAALQSTYIRYRGNQYHLNQLWTAWFEPFTIGPVNPFVVVPFLSDFLISQGTFWSKFADITPWPFYEMFVATAPVGYYSSAATPLVTFQPAVSGFGNAQVNLVSRINPLPWTQLAYPNPNSATPEWISDKWDALDLFDIAPYSYISSDVMYSSEDLANFYVIDPMSIVTAPGTTASSIQPAIAVLGCMYDQNGINRYGFRPQIHTTRWWIDPLAITAATATSAATGPDSTEYPGPAQFVAVLSRLASIYEPLPNMLKGEITVPLWPSVLVGNKFQCIPFKDNVPYTFYITGVTHNYVFGGPSTTKITVERGLSSDNYGAVADILIPLHQGLIDRIDGKLVPRSDSGRGLTYVTIDDLDPSSPAFFLANGTGPSGGF